MRVLFVQFGNFAEAHDRLRAGGPETYRDQRRSVDFVAGLAGDHDVTVVALGESEPHDRALGPRLRSIALPGWTQPRATLRALFDRLSPDVLICRSPHRGALAEARRRRIPTLPAFADILAPGGLRASLENLLLRRLLLSPDVPCVANHSLNASRSLATVLRIPRDRIVPWDWSRLPTPYDAKPGPARPDAFRALYVGLIDAQKGVGDILAALRLLLDHGLPLSVSLAGPGDLAFWRAEAERLGVAQAATFLGTVPHNEVLQRMHDHDLVLVPSRHDYAEGLPNTIYEGLASRSPLAVSDHPAFRGRLRPDEDAVVFRAADPASLAEAMARLCADPALYARLSGNALAALDRLYIGPEWCDLMRLFLDDPRDGTGWVARHSLAALDP